MCLATQSPSVDVLFTPPFAIRHLCTSVLGTSARDEVPSPHELKSGDRRLVSTYDGPSGARVQKGTDAEVGSLVVYIEDQCHVADEADWP